jgi:hypothetical protein
MKIRDNDLLVLHELAAVRVCEAVEASTDVPEECGQLTSRRTRAFGELGNHSAHKSGHYVRIGKSCRHGS